jgi:acylphosphatase
MSDNNQMYVIVHGRVQGVSFRYYTKVTAMKFGIGGWVRNLPDGTVEVTAEGKQSNLNDLLAFLQHGPAGAKVTDIAVEWRPASGKFNDFSIRY